MNQNRILRWTRKGFLPFSWTQFESFESLVLAPSLRDKLNQKVDSFLKGKEVFHHQKLTWRYGVYFYGPSGSGKSAASRGLAYRLGWTHITIPAHEILDAHLLEHALFQICSQENKVVVFEDIDIVLKRVEPIVFFTLLDHAMERAEGTLWVATTRHAEDVPKTQLLRPGRFDEAIRFELPSTALRRVILSQILGVQDQQPQAQMQTPADLSEISEAQSSVPESSPDPLAEWTDLSQGFSFSHFEELRQIRVRGYLEGRDPAQTIEELVGYIRDQMIAGDRLGGISDEAQQVEDRVRHIDPRVLLAALNMTDTFRTLMEKVVASAFQQAQTTQSEEGTS